MVYNWQLPDWPEFRYGTASLQAPLLRFHELAGRIAGAMGALAEADQGETSSDLLASEALETSQIEGERLNPVEVRSSIRRQLGLPIDGPDATDLRAIGAAELIVAARADLDAPLSEAMLFDWHQKLMQGRRQVLIGAWRTHSDPMQIVSGSDPARPRVHFEAPPSAQVPVEMGRFIHWFNATGPQAEQPMLRAPVRAAIAHLYFESIHPFEDGNGRIGRAVAERALYQTLGFALPLVISKAIESQRRTYYQALESAQRSNEITAWVEYFVDMILRAQDLTEQTIDFVVRKARFLDRHAPTFNERQSKAVLRMFEAGPEGFVGGMTAAKYMAITQASKATATRDLTQLAERGVLNPVGAGRSARYELRLED